MNAKGWAFGLNELKHRNDVHRCKGSICVIKTGHGRAKGTRRSMSSNPHSCIGFWLGLNFSGEDLWAQSSKDWSRRTSLNETLLLLEEINVAIVVDAETVTGGSTEQIKEGNWRPKFRGFVEKISDRKARDGIAHVLDIEEKESPCGRSGEKAADLDPCCMNDTVKSSLNRDTKLALRQWKGGNWLPQSSMMHLPAMRRWVHPIPTGRGFV